MAAGEVIAQTLFAVDGGVKAVELQEQNGLAILSATLAQVICFPSTGGVLELLHLNAQTVKEDVSSSPVKLGGMTHGATAGSA